MPPLLTIWNPNSRSSASARRWPRAWRRGLRAPSGNSSPRGSASSCRRETPLEVRLDVGDLERRQLGVRVPVEWIRLHRIVDAVGALDRVEHERAVLGAAADRAELVGRPRERHRAGARHAAERRPEAGHAAGARRRGDRAVRLRADAESDAARGRCRRRTGGRSARTGLRVPRIARAFLPPAIALGERAECELGDENGARLVEAGDDRAPRSRTSGSDRGRRPTSWDSPSPRADPSRPTECRAADRDTCRAKSRRRTPSPA